MKTKIKKIKPAKVMTDRLNGYAYWRITGPDPDTNKRVNQEFYGTREQAEQVRIGKGGSLDAPFFY